MGLTSEKSEPEGAHWADSTSFQTMMNRDATNTGGHASSAADTADPNASSNTLDERDHDDQHAGSRKDRICTMFVSADVPVIRIGGDGLMSLIQVKVKSAVESTERVEIWIMCKIR